MQTNVMFFWAISLQFIGQIDATSLEKCIFLSTLMPNNNFFVAVVLTNYNSFLVEPTGSLWLGCEELKADCGHELPPRPDLPDCTALASHVHICHSDWFGDLKRLKKVLGLILGYGPALAGRRVKSSPYPLKCQADEPILLGAKTLRGQSTLENLFLWLHQDHKARLIVLVVRHPSPPLP